MLTLGQKGATASQGTLRRHARVDNFFDQLAGDKDAGILVAAYRAMSFVQLADAWHAYCPAAAIAAGSRRALSMVIGTLD